MDDALLMSGHQRLGGLFGNRKRLVEGDGATRDAFVQTFAVDEFQHEEL